MALRHFDGFTAYSAVGDLSASGLYVVSDPSNNLQIIQNGGSAVLGALRVGHASRSPATVYKTITASSHVMAGFWIDYTGFDTLGGDTYDAIFKLAASEYSSVAELILYSTGELAVRTDGSDEIFRSGDRQYSPSGTEVNYLTVGSHRIELRVLSASTLGEVEIVVDGKIWGLITGITYMNGYDVERVYIQTGQYGAGAKFDIDSLYVFDDTGAYNNRLLGDWTTQVLRPINDSGTPQFSVSVPQTIIVTPTTITPECGSIYADGIAPQAVELGVEQRAPDTAAVTVRGYAPTVTLSSRNAQNVDDGAIHDADATHTYSTANAQIDRFVTADTLAGEICRVQAVNVCCVARRDDTAQNFRTKITHGSSTTDGANVALNNPEWRPVIQSYAANPATGTQWLDSEVEAAKFGYESRA